MADNTLNLIWMPRSAHLTLDPPPLLCRRTESPPLPRPEAQVEPDPRGAGHGGSVCPEDRYHQQPAGAAVRLCLPEEDRRFLRSCLSKVSTKDLGEVGDMITDLIGELKSFDANEEQQKGIMGFFKKKTSQLDALKTKYDKTETNVEKIQSMLEAHQVQLLKDIAMLDKMYELNMAYFKELSMYILAGKKKLADVRANELQQAMDKAKVSGLPEDAQAARDLADQCERFEKSCMIWN